jgi:hypothetical protein
MEFEAGLSKSSRSRVLCCVATVDRRGRTIFVADAHRDDGKRFIVRADQKLTAFLELERRLSDRMPNRTAPSSISSL